MKSARRSVFATVFLIRAGAAFAQSSGLAEREVDRALEASSFRAGPLRLTPQLRLGAGYDDNALSSAIAPQSDVSFLAGPGLRAVVPFGRRGFLDVYEEVDFVYFRDLTVLRDIFDVTRFGGAVGGKNVLVRASGEFRSEKTRPSSEFDIPVDQVTRRQEASVAVALGRRHELTFGYSRASVSIGDPAAALLGASVKSRLDRTENELHVELARHLTSRTSFLFEGFHSRLDFVQNLAQGEPLVYGGRGGFSFSPKGNARGQILVGFKDVRAAPGTPSFRGLTAAVDTKLRLGDHVRAGAVFARDVQPSVLDGSWYFVENRYGGSVTLYFAERASLEPSVVLGKNTYPVAVRAGAAGVRALQSVVDEFENYSLTFGYRVTGAWIASATANYFRRGSSVALFQKDRFVLSFGFSHEL